MANLLVMPTIDAANITDKLLKMVAGGGIAIGLILLDADKTVHMLMPSSTMRRFVNMKAFTAAETAARMRSGV